MSRIRLSIEQVQLCERLWTVMESNCRGRKVLQREAPAPKSMPAASRTLRRALSEPLLRHNSPAKESTRVLPASGHKCAVLATLGVGLDRWFVGKPTAPTDVLCKAGGTLREAAEGDDSDSSSDPGSPRCGRQLMRAPTRKRPRSCSGLGSAGSSTMDAKTPLELESVRGPTKVGYAERVQTLKEYAGDSHLELKDDVTVDRVMTLFMNVLFLRGVHLTMGEKLLAAWCWTYSDFSRFGGRKLPRSHQALKGWRLKAPPRSRKPEALPVIMGLAAMMMAHLGSPAMGIWVLVCFGAYLRPSECMGLHRRDFIPPVGRMTNFWSLLVCAEDAGLVSKTGTRDDSVIWDMEELLWMGPVFSALRRAGDLNGSAWNFTYLDLMKVFRAATARIGAKHVVPYVLRHSGPSWDRLQGRRSQEQVMKRGRWRSLQSVARYEKAGRVTQKYQEYTLAQRAFFERAAVDVAKVFQGLLAPYGM